MEDEELEDFSDEDFWNSGPIDCSRPDIQFEYVVCLYGQGDCFFSLIDKEDWKIVMSANDPCAGLGKIRPSRQAYFSNVLDLVRFCQENKITLLDSSHGYVY